MNKLRNIVFITLLSMLGVVASHAQEEARGRFALPHDVTWKTTKVPAGSYQFWFQRIGSSGLLRLSKLNGERASFVMTVPDVNVQPGTYGEGQLIVNSSLDSSYVSSLELPEFGLVLRFPVPDQTSELSARAEVTVTEVVTH